MDEGGIFEGIKNAVHTVFNGKYKTGGQLSQFTARVHQSGRVGEKFEFGHQAVKDRLNLIDPLFTAVALFRLGDMMGHPGKHLFRTFINPSCPIPFKVSPFQHPYGVVG